MQMSWAFEESLFHESKLKMKLLSSVASKNDLYTLSQNIPHAIPWQEHVFGPQFSEIVSCSERLGLFMKFASNLNSE